MIVKIVKRKEEDEKQDRPKLHKGRKNREEAEDKQHNCVRRPEVMPRGGFRSASQIREEF